MASDQLKPILKLNKNHPPTTTLPEESLFYAKTNPALHQTSRVSSIYSTNMIYDVKGDPILQISSQEPSTSSKPTHNKKTSFKPIISCAKLLNLIFSRKKYWF